jgi:hypothetical protein
MINSELGIAGLAVVLVTEFKLRSAGWLDVSFGGYSDRWSFKLVVQQVSH